MTKLDPNLLEYKGILDGLFDGIYIVDRQRQIVYWNRAAERLTGFKADEVVGSHCFDAILTHVDECGNDLCQGKCPLAATMEDGRARENEVFLHHREGARVPVLVRTTPLRDKQGEIIGGIEIFSDNSNQFDMRREIAHLIRLTRLDELTQVGNRRFAEQTLEEAVHMLDRYDMRFGVLMIDIDHFKTFNDQHGHHIGDAVLRMTARTLQVNLRSSDLISRWGGEEFLVIVKQVAGEEFERVAEKLRVLVKGSYFFVDDQMISVTISIGGIVPQKGESPEKVVERADALMYQAKEAGRDRISVQINNL